MTPDSSRPLLVIGLTGGIGSGKSLVADEFSRLGITVVDTDQIAHELTGPGGAAIDAIRHAFGDKSVAPDGRMDRDWIRQRVFQDGAERKRLEAILHPMIGTLSRERIAAATSSYAVLAVPLLIESGNWHKRVDRVLVVDCPVETQIARVMARNGLPREQVQAIIDAQVAREKRLAAADDVIDNNGTKAQAIAATQALHQQYLALVSQA